MNRKSPSPKSRLAWLDRFPKARVMVVGDIMHDVFIWGKVKRISPEAPVPVVEVERETTLLGGAANVVNNVRALRAKAMMAGVVGRDAAGEAVLKALEDIGADHSCVHRSVRRPTMVKTRIIAHQQQVVRFDREDFAELKPGTLKKLIESITQTLDRVDAVIVSDYAKSLISRGLMERLVALCREKNKILAVDPKPAHMDWYRGSTLVTPNNAEAGLAAGFEIHTDEDVDRAGKILLDRLGSAAVLITRGEKGMSLFRPGNKPVHIPARAREVYDVTGAGDTVIGVVTVALVAGMGMVEAVKVANQAAGIVVGKVGTSVATLDELKSMVSNRKAR